MTLTHRLAALLLAAALVAGCGNDAPTTRSDEETDTGATPTEATAAGDGTPIGPAPAAPAASEKVPTLSDAATTTDSGLQFEDTTVGEGDTAAEGDLVRVHYTGWLEDGTQFDSSRGGDPLSFTLGEGRVIAGWDEGVAGMQVGGRRLLRIPAALGYGETGQGIIPAGATLIFDVELLEILKPPTLALAETFTTTDSGLEYAILAEGAGDAAAEGDLVTVNYATWLEDGTFLDGSAQSGEPARFVLGTARLPGLNEGITGMKAGETRQLRIPPELAYGETGGGSIPPNTPVIFEIEMVEREALPDPTPVDEYTTTESGLQYAILTEGTGDAAASGDTVLVHYSGWLESGIQFDSSLAAGQPLPVTLGAGQVIPGWDEGLVGMKVGEKRQLRIPPALGYGEADQGLIPPNSTLIFEVELVEIQ